MKHRYYKRLSVIFEFHTGGLILNNSSSLIIKYGGDIMKLKAIILDKKGIDKYSHIA